MYCPACAMRGPSGTTVSGLCTTSTATTHSPVRCVDFSVMTSIQKVFVPKEARMGRGRAGNVIVL